jgi:putative endonuclease
VRLTSPKQAQGGAIEQLVVGWLAARGLRTIARNVHCRLGELDLVMRDGDAVVFIEVRYRRTSSRGGAHGSVDGRKQARIAGAARWFLAGRPQLANQPCRFDVVAVSGDAPYRIDWIRDAFQPIA